MRTDVDNHPVFAHLTKLAPKSVLVAVGITASEGASDVEQGFLRINVNTLSFRVEDSRLLMGLHARRVSHSTEGGT